MGHTLPFLACSSLPAQMLLIPVNMCTWCLRTDADTMQTAKQYAAVSLMNMFCTSQALNFHLHRNMLLSMYRWSGPRGTDWDQGYLTVETGTVHARTRNGWPVNGTSDSAVVVLGARTGFLDMSLMASPTYDGMVAAFGVACLLCLLHSQHSCLTGCLT